MGRFLYCKNEPVYDVDNKIIVNDKLVPGLLKINSSDSGFLDWLRFRYSSGTNTLARELKAKIFGQGKRDIYDETTHMLTFFDCYWVKDSEDTTMFEAISPYYTEFFTGEKEYNGEAVPTLYTPGFKGKEWRANGNLYKENCEIELEAYKVCVAAGVRCNEIIKSGDGIECKNLTNPDLMLEQLNMSGKVDGDNFTEEDIINLFGADAIRMYTIDAILGNGDRHEGNIAYYRDANTGEYIGMSPLYDFDHTLDDKNQEVRKYFYDYLKYIGKDEKSEVLRICNQVAESSEVLEIFRNRAESMISYISG